MKIQYYYFLFILVIYSCGSKGSFKQLDENCILIRKSHNAYEIGKEFWFENQDGEVVVPKNKYLGTFNDTIRRFGFVLNKQGQVFAIDCVGEEMYEVFKFDNGPDYAEEGLFRILESGKIGYADAVTGEIIIKPMYQCAFPFENGRARVSLNCLTETIDEYSNWVSDEWFEIDKSGNQIFAKQ